MSSILESLYAKYNLNEAAGGYGEVVDALEKGKIYSNPDWPEVQFKFIEAGIDNGIKYAKFEPMNEYSKQIAIDDAEAADEEFDGFAYFDDESVYYTFFDSMEDEDDEVEDY